MNDLQMGSVPLIEQETTISYCRTEDGAVIWTSDRTQITRLDKLCENSPDFYRVKEIGKTKDGLLLSKTYTVRDKSLITFRSKKITRVLTEDQRAAIAERFEASRNAR